MPKDAFGRFISSPAATVHPPSNRPSIELDYKGKMVALDNRSVAVYVDGAQCAAFLWGSSGDDVYPLDLWVSSLKNLDFSLEDIVSEWHGAYHLRSAIFAPIPNVIGSNEFKGHPVALHLRDAIPRAGFKVVDFIPFVGLMNWREFTRSGRFHTKVWRGFFRLSEKIVRQESENKLTSDVAAFALGMSQLKKLRSNISSIELDCY